VQPATSDKVNARAGRHDFNLLSYLAKGNA